jgi:hypothetical protein
MSWIFTLVGTTVGGWLGWWLGARVGIMTAFFLSSIGTAAGLYGARRFMRAYLD